jgi:flagellin
MRSQIRGLDQATRNAQDGKSLLQTAEGALNETHSILQRMKELAVQAANDTNTTFDREQIQSEINQLKTEVDRISRDTEFNTMKLLNGTMGSTATAKSTTDFTTTELSVAGVNVKGGTYQLKLNGAAGGLVTGVKSLNVNGTDLQIEDAIHLQTGAKYGEYRLDFTKNLNGNAYDVTLTGPDGRYEIMTAVDGKNPVKFEKLNVEVEFDTNVNLTGDSGYISFTNEQPLSFTLTMPDAANPSQLGTDTITLPLTYSGGYINIGGIQFEATVGMADDNGTTTIDLIDKSIKLHVGANADQTWGWSIRDSSSTAWGINLVDLSAG